VASLTCDYFLITYCGEVDEGAEVNVFRPLSDPTRRAILDALFRVDGQFAALCELFADMTRFAVMKHLKVLEAANLVELDQEIAGEPNRAPSSRRQA
jgi:DNA-binding transcriptional ArsR family regulator